MKARRWALIGCYVLAIVGTSIAVFLHYDPSLAHRLGSMRVGEFTIAAVLSLVGVAYGTWSAVQGVLDFVKKRVNPTYVQDETEQLLDGVAKDLGSTLRSTADKEIEARGLKYPKPMPVRWRQLAGTAPSGRKLTAPRPPGVAALGDIAGRVRRGDFKRFVLIGEPGSGKTAVTLFLQRDLIAQKPDPAELIPLVLPLSTWNPDVKLLDWATARLEERFPKFAKPLTADSPDSAAKKLLHNGRIRLILDAMDELPEQLLSRVFTKINQEGADFPVVITCRTADYRRASRRAGESGGSVALADAQVFELLPPKIEMIEEYLVGTGLRDRWKRVFALLHDEGGALAKALSTPLMIWLTQRNYEERRPDEFAELLYGGQLRTQQDVKDHLLDGFVPAMYKDDNAPRAIRYFRFIAEHVRARADSEYELPSGEGLVPMVDNGQDIAWWRLVNDRRARLTDSLLLIVVGGLIPGACLGLGWATATWNWLPHPAPLISGLVLGVGCTVGMAMGCLRNNPPPTGTQFSRPGNVLVSAIVLGCAMVVGGAASLAMSRNLASAPVSLIVALPVALAYTFTNPYVDAARVATPLRHYRADIQQTFVYTVAYGTGVGALAAVYRPWPISLALGVMAGIAGGFTYGAVYKVAYGRNMPAGMVAWLRFRVVHFRLALTGNLPWRYFAFLDRAHQRGVLRQSGGNYQFSHITLRDRLVLEPAEAGKQMTA